MKTFIFEGRRDNEFCECGVTEQNQITEGWALGFELVDPEAGEGILVTGEYERFGSPDWDLSVTTIDSTDVSPEMPDWEIRVEPKEAKEGPRIVVKAPDGCRVTPVTLVPQAGIE